MIIKFIFFFFFLFLMLIFLMGFSIIRGVKRMFFGKETNKQQPYQRHTTAGNSRNTQSSASSSYGYAEEVHDEPRYRRHKKVYSHDEGEYVDYEEVKD